MNQSKAVTLLTPKCRFPMLMLCPTSFSTSSFGTGGEGGVIFLSLPKSIFQNDLQFSSEILTMLTKLR